ncbi:MAG: hypothetical protein SFV32_07305 [Opitutaceae bacterium]|nr:hypothetical protein [Opitutaceae bacterium]
MEHTEIVTANELQTYAERSDSEAVIPELVSLLVKESVEDLSLCRIPYGDMINQPGWDGLVETEIGHREFVPKKKSFWEMGTGGKPQKKATKDFKGRTRSMANTVRQEATYVVVTPHSRLWPEPSQTRWKTKYAKFGWKEVKIVDGVQLADWLREYPAIGKWLLKKIGLVDKAHGFSTPAEHWENLAQSSRNGDPPLPARLFLVGRDHASTQLQHLFEGKSSQLLIATESEHDANDFVAAFLGSLDPEVQQIFRNRCLFIKEPDAWLSMTSLRDRHVLVAHPNLDLVDIGEQLHLAAKKRGHAVVIPILGAAGAGAESVVSLRSPTQHAIESCLTEAKFAHERAKELAGAGAHSLAALKRHLRGLSDIPPYANWASARLIAQASLFARWSGQNASDKAAMEIVLGKSYGEWIESLRPESLRPDTPLTQRNEQWKIISRGEAWTALGPRLHDDDLERFGKMALTVLGERNPKFELPPDERFAAIIKGKSLMHSSGLRRGVAETLALIGSRSRSLTSCSQNKAEITAILTIRALLENADWITWASLNDELPLLAEAAPDEFLDRVEAALLDSSGPFKAVFAQEGSGITGANYMTGLLWGLETLAWSPEHLIRVVAILGDLAAIDPGGNWSNRPVNSIKDILLPWHPQTMAPVIKRRAALQAVYMDNPAVGWKLILSLLPSSHGFTIGTRKPAWRTFLPQGHTNRVTHQEYAEQISAYAELAVSLAADNIDKLVDLIDRLPDLPKTAHVKVLEHLGSPTVQKAKESDRVTIWDALTDLVAKHRKYADARWALSKRAVDAIASATAPLTPHSPVFRHRRIFSDRDFDLFDAKGNYDAQRIALDGERTAVVTDLFQSGGMAGIFELARQAASPAKVGEALGRSTIAGLDALVLPTLLAESDSLRERIVHGFVWARYWARKSVWLDQLPVESWSRTQKVAFLTMLPFLHEIWERAECLLGSDAGDYWRSVPVNPWNEKEHTLIAVERLLAVSRPRSALQCLHRMSVDKIPIPSALATKTLLAAVPESSEPVQIDQHDALDVIKSLQDNPEASADELFRVEWAYLPILDHEFGDVPTTLEQRLADNPAFFAELIGLIFRSEKQVVKKTQSEQQQAIAKNAFGLLRAWRRVPGRKKDGTFDPVAFAWWLNEVKRLTSESGHLDIAMNQLGETLVYAPVDSDGLWIHRTIADALNSKDAGEMRSGFRIELFNSRGVHDFTAGREEREIAAGFIQKADALENNGYHRFATAIRELANDYIRDAEQEEKRGPFGD